MDGVLPGVLIFVPWEPWAHKSCRAKWGLWYDISREWWVLECTVPTKVIQRARAS